MLRPEAWVLQKRMFGQNARGETWQGGVMMRFFFFQPLVFESLGGVSVEAVQVLKGLNKAVAGNTESSVEDVAQRFWQRLGVQMLRGNYRAFARRVEGICRVGLGTLSPTLMG